VTTEEETYTGICDNYFALADERQRAVPKLAVKCEFFRTVDLHYQRSLRENPYGRRSRF
jgi:hypothetical protein